MSRTGQRLTSAWNISGKRSCTSSSSKDSGSTRLQFAPLAGTASEGGGTHSILEAALLGGGSGISTEEPSAAARLATLAESPSGLCANVLETQALPATLSVRADWTDSQRIFSQSLGLSTKEFLEEELSALHAARARSSTGAIDEASASGGTCELLESEIRTPTSQPPSLHRGHLEPSSPQRESAARHIQAVVRGRLTRAGGKLCTDVRENVPQAAEQEVERLTQVIKSYECQVLPQLMVERAVLNCELTKTRTEAREAAEASERDKEALLDRVAEFEAETQELRSQLALARIRIGRRGGG